MECNPNINQKKLTAFCKERDIVIVGYSPLSAADDTLLLSNPKVVNIAKKHNKTPAQVILNYLVSDLPVIFRSVSLMWNFPGGQFGCCGDSQIGHPFQN